LATVQVERVSIIRWKKNRTVGTSAALSVGVCVGLSQSCLSGTFPPFRRPFSARPVILDMVRSRVSSRSNCANLSRMLSISMPLESEVSKCCVAETRVTPCALSVSQNS